jgi:hypothetical protein
VGKPSAGETTYGTFLSGAIIFHMQMTYEIWRKPYDQNYAGR